MLFCNLKPANKGHSLVDPHNLYDDKNSIVTILDYQSGRDEEMGAKILQPVLLVERIRQNKHFAYLFYLKQNKNNTFEFCWVEGAPNKDILSPEGDVCFMSYDIDSADNKKLVKELKKNGRDFAAKEKITSDDLYKWFIKILLGHFHYIRCPATYVDLLSHGCKKIINLNKHFSIKPSALHLNPQPALLPSVRAQKAAMEKFNRAFENPPYNDLSQKPYDDIHRTNAPLRLNH